MVDFVGGAKGAAGGAAVGSAFGPWGAGIGAGVGGLLGLGLFGGDDNPQAKAQADIQAKLQQLADGYQGRAAPQTGPAAAVNQSSIRQNQAGLIAQLESMANGTGPSAAAIQMREAMDRAAAAQTSAIAGSGGRGINQGAAYLNAANNTAAIQAQGARDTATIRAQEQLNAVGQLGQNLAQVRGADDQMSQFQASTANQIALANLQAQLQTMALNDEAQLKALYGALGANVNPGPGLGDQILAGGANALPSILQRDLGQQQMAQKTTQPYNYGRDDLMYG